jgi:DUF1680 family protein
VAELVRIAIIESGFAERKFPMTGVDRITAIIISCAVVCSWNMAKAQQTQPSAKDATTGDNLAGAASASTSHVSRDQTITSINSGYNPRRSNDNSHGAYGNWPDVGAEWVEYRWSRPINTNRIAVYWFADGRGIKLPKTSRLLYWNGTDFIPVPDAQGLGVSGNKYNITTFPTITTSRLRLEFESLVRAVNFSTGVLQWKVFDAGGSPDFPPLVKAGVDRVVLLPGETFLHGSIRSVKDTGAANVIWSKVSGPGRVTFADAHADVTTAGFSEAGDYELKLTAGDDQLTGSDTLHVRVDPARPIAPLEPVYTRTYKINNPLWNRTIKNVIVNWIPHCYTELSDLNLKEGGINNFIQAAKKLAGQPAGRHIGYPFADAYVHNTVESMCLALMVDPQGDPEIISAQDAIRAKLNEWIPIILSAQEPDGYLQTRFTLDPRNPPHWDRRTRGEHEGYVAGYFIESAIANYVMTDGKDLRMYNAAKKLADCWYINIGPPPKKAWYDGHEEMEQALVRFGRLVNDVEGPGKGQKYIELAKFLLDCRNNGGEYDQTYAPVTQQYEAVGHAVRAAYVYSAMTDIVAETADVDYQSAVKSIWDDLVNRKYYITGGIGSGETSEGFGGDYSLPNNSYCESCSGCGELFFQHNMSLAYQDAKYADLYEQTLYNAILGDLDLQGKNFYYANPLETPEHGGARYPWHDCPCCVGNIPRTLLSLPTWMYSKSADNLYVNLFIGSTVTINNVAGGDVQMVQTTDYPWSGKVSITVNPASPSNFSIRIRLPHRDVSSLYASSPASDGITSISVNGMPIAQPVIERGYAVITRSWTPGDKIDLVLPMNPQQIKTDDRVVADRGRVALRYGPLIYNIEQADHQNVDLALKSDSPLTAQWSPNLLGGVMVIRGTFVDGSPMMAIPNYARCNRGGRSLVWMHDQ